MKGTDLLEGLNFIDEAFVDEASDECEITKDKKYPIPFFVMEVAAACLVLFLVLSGAITVFLDYYTQKKPDDILVEVTGETDAPTPDVTDDTTDEPKQTENPVILNTEKPKDDSSLKNAIKDAMNDGMFSIDDSVFIPQINDSNGSNYPTPTKRPLPNVDDDYLASIDKTTPRPEGPNVPNLMDPTKTPSPNISGGIGNGDGSGNVPNTPEPKPTKSPNGDGLHPQGTFPPNHESNTPWQDDPIVSHTARPAPTPAPTEDSPRPTGGSDDLWDTEGPRETEPSDLPWVPTPTIPPVSSEPTRQPTPSLEPTVEAPMPSSRPTPTPEPMLTPTPTVAPTPTKNPGQLPATTPTPSPTPSPTPTPTPNPGVEEE